MTDAFGLRAFLLALAVVAVWGTNFVVIRLGLDALPPLLFAALRFTWRRCRWCFSSSAPPCRGGSGAYGLFIGVGQFGLLFIAIDGLIAPGLASLVVQVQVVFTIGLAMRGTGERLSAGAICGTGAGALAGVGIILAHTGGTTTPLGVALVVGAAFGWSLGNMVQRRVGRVDMLAFVVWSSLFAIPPLFALAFLFEGAPAIGAAVSAATPDRLGGGGVAGGGQHHVRLWRLGLAAGALSGGERGADGAAGAGVRHGVGGAVARRAVAGVETCRRRADHRRAGGEPVRPPPDRSPRHQPLMVKL